MRTRRQRIIAVLVAVFQILGMISPGSFAAADETYVSGEVSWTSSGQTVFCMTTDMSQEARSELAEQGYYILIRQTDEYGTVSYASRKFSEITANGFEVFQTFKTRVDGYDNDTGAGSRSVYDIKIAKLENNNYDEWVSVFEEVYRTKGKTDGSPAYVWELKGNRNSDLVITEEGPFDVRITFRDKDGNAIPAPAVDGNYYLIALDVGQGGDFSADNVATLPSNTYWYIEKLSGFDGTSTPTVVSVPGFSNVIYEDYSADPSHPIGTAYQDLPPEVKSRIKVRLVHSTREIQTFGNLRQWAGSNEVTVYNAAINGSFAGYTPDAGNGPVTDGAVDYQIGFRKKEPISHKVVIHFDPADNAVTIPGEDYYLLLEATSLDGTRQYYKTVELKTNGDVTTTINLDEQWSNGQTFSPNWKDITATVIRKNPGATITPGPNSPDPSAYTEAFTIGNNSFTYDKKETTDSSGNLTSIEHKLTLTGNPLENALKPAQILGPGINYGITAGVFDQVGHMETNFATNLYRCSAGNQVNVDPDLGNDTGAIAAAKIEGKMHMNSQRDVVLFVDKADANKVDHNTAHTILVESTQSKISESIVNPILNYGQAMSDSLKAKEATYAPSSPNIDLTQFPDGKTIYIDPSRIPSVFNGTGGGLNIKMHPGQTVVFNIPNENVKVGQIQYTFTDGVSWASDAGRERIAQNTVFNMPNAKNVELNEAIGMFLIPRTDSKTTITQSSEGWVITGGTMTSRTQSNEWHNRNKNLSKVADADASFGKKLDDRTPAAGEVFEFDIYRWDENADNDTGDSHWTRVDTIRNDGQSMNYTFKNGTGHVFRIKEKGKASGTGGNYFYDEKEYYVTVVQMGYENVVYAAFPEYYADAGHAVERFRNNDISGTPSTSRFKGVIDATDDTNSISSITFRNETRNTQTAHLQAEKIINEWGNETEFSFVLKQAPGGLYPPMPADAVNGSDTAYSEYAQAVSAPADRTFTKTVTVEKSTGVEASFGTIEYSEPGTYYYFIQEIIPGSARAIDTDNGNKLLDTTYANDQQYSRYYLDGMEYDNTPVTVAVAVVSLDTEPVVTYDSDPSKKYAEFTNTYRRARTDLKATKQIEGKRFKFADGDKWNFTVTAADADDAANTDIPMPEITSVVLQPDADRWIVPIDFGTIEYTIADAGKTYVYTITETDDAGNVIGTKQVTVEVALDPATNGLKATQTTDEGGTSFTNFDAGSTTASVEKTWVDGNGNPVANNAGTATVQLIAVKEEEITPPVQTGKLTVRVEGTDDLPDGTGIQVTVAGITRTLNAGNSWRTTFDDVPAGGQTLTTEVTGDYVTVTPASTAVTITDGTENVTLEASYLPPKKDVKVRIDWGNGEVPTGSITATADDGTRVVLNSGNDWTGYLHSMTAGTRYSVTVTDRNGVTWTSGQTQGITVANSNDNELVFSGNYNPFTAEIPVSISWNDVPENVSVTVTAANASGGNDTQTITLNGSGTNWTGKFEGLREGADYTITTRISGQNAENASLNPDGAQTVKAGNTARYTGHYEEGIPENEKVTLRIFKKSTGQNDNVKIYGPEEFRIGQPIAVTVTVHGWGFSANYRATNGQSGKTRPQNTNNDYTDTINFTFSTPGEHTIWIESPWGLSAVIGATASQASATGLVRNLFRPNMLIAASGVSDVSFSSTSPAITIQDNLKQLDQIVGGIEEGGYTLVGDPVELNQANGWQHDWGTLPEYYRDEDGTIHRLKYYVIETAATKTSGNTYSTNSTTGLTTIKNTYADTTEITLDGTKTLNGRDMTAREFSFTVTEGTTTAANGTNAAAGKGEAGTITFGEIRYDQDDVGIHTYTVTETAPGGKISQTGKTSFTVKVEVYIDADGNLKARKTADSETVAFVNQYTDRTEITLEGTKTLRGRDMEAGEFTFVVKDENDAVVTTGTNAAAGKGTPGAITFGKIEYTQEDVGTHTYTVTETAPGRNVTQTGTTSYTVEVEVRINEQDELTATLVNPDQKIAFTNAYEAATSITPEGTKTLTGRNMEAGEFNFTVKEGGTTVATGTNAGAGKDTPGTITFTAIPYTQDSIGVHTYTVTEDATVPGNVEQTGTESFTVKVNVYPEADGSLKAQVVESESGTVAFTNKYEAETTITLEGTKTLTGRDMTAGEFRFIAAENGEQAATGTNAAANNGDAGNITFTPITYTQDDIGEHTYTITEVTPEQANVTQTGETSFEVKVNVSVGTDGELVAEVTQDSQSVAFENTYADKTEITLPGTKTLSGRNMKDEEFSFKVKEDDTTVATGTNAAAGKDTPGAITFSEIEYNETQVGLHTYTVTEDTPWSEYVTQTGKKTSFTVKVNVYIDQQGELQAEIVEDDSDEIAFTNQYADTAEIALEGTKTLAGRPMTAGEFTFVVTENSEEVVTGKNGTAAAGAEGAITFDAIRYNQDDIGEHTYTVTEKMPLPGNVTQTGTISYIVKVNVYPDDTTDKLTARLAENAPEIEFTNEYKDDTELKLHGTKTLTGRTMKAGEFDFVVKEGTETVTTGKNVGAQSGEEAAIEFDQIRYTQADIGEHTYTVTEVTPTQANVTQTGTTSFTVKVKVFADANGELQAEVLENSDTVKFTNKYEDTAEILLEGTKTLTGRNMDEDEFTFVVMEGEKRIQAVGHAGADKGTAGAISFEKIHYTQNDIGEHIYTITETRPNQPNVEQTGTTSYTVKVDVQVDKDGELTAKLAGNAPTIAFENRYTDTAEVNLRGTKTLTGREMKAGEFTFVVKEGDTVIARGTHDGAEAGNTAAITFPTIRYNQDNVGTHTYTVTELPKTAQQNNVTVDTTSYTVTVVVAIGTDGQLTATRTDSSTLAFTNKYTDTTSITLEGTKTLTGRAMEAEEFSFTVTEDGNPVASGKNDANGKITFTAIHYDETHIGEHIYTVTEDQPTKANVSQTGTASFTVKVNVYVDEDGELQAAEMKEADGSQKIAFTNQYADTTEITLHGTKTLTGREMKAGEFQFAVMDGTDEIVTGTNDGAEAGQPAAVTFAPIRYTEADVGDHEYTVVEKEMTDIQKKHVTQGTPDGFSVTVEVYIDSQGELQARIKDGSETVAFTNAFTATTTLPLEGTKTLTGRDMHEDEFHFTVTEHKGTADTEVVTIGHNLAAPNGVPGKIEFNAIEYDQNAIGEHVYTVTEDPTPLPNITQTGTNSFSLKVNVYVDEEDGELKAKLIEEESQEIAFTNAYSGEAEITLEGTKTLIGREMRADEFSFVVTEEGKTEPVATGKNIGAEAGEPGEIIFTAIKYTEADIGPHVYTVTETDPGKDNIERDKRSFTVTVEVSTDSANQHKLKAEIVPAGTEAIAFTNVFTDTAAITLEGTKTLTGRDMKAGEFKFAVKENGSAVINSENEAITGTNAAALNGEEADITFMTIEYDQDDIGEHIYTITEAEPTQANVKQTGKTSFTVKVDVYVDEDRELQAKIVESDSEEITFTNEYTDTTEITLEGTKTLTGREMKAGEFSFVVMEGNNEVVSATHDGAEAGKAGAIRFPAIKYDQDDAGEHTYTITETTPGQAHVTPGTESFEVTVDVYVDENDGELKAELLSGSDTVAFTNAYAHTAVLTLEGTKTLTGRDMTAGEFKFSVKEDGSEVTTGRNAADTTKGTAGAIAFNEITYTEKDIGEHIYVVTETGTLPNNVRQTGKTSFTVKVKVSVGENGDLQAKVMEEESQPIAFTNAYADTAEITLDATKALDGREMTAGEFTFEIWEGENKLVTGTHHDGAVTGNTAAVTFPKITYNHDNVGTHTYTVKETKPAQNHVTQTGTTKEYTVVVEVEIDEYGELQAKLVSGGTGIAFTNEYRDDYVFTLEGTKTLTGRDMEAGEFSFTAKENGEVKATGENKAADEDDEGEITFTPITFTQADIGEHIYTITEDTPLPKNVTHTGTQYFSVRVKVYVDDEGELQAEVMQDSQRVAFTNKYEDKARFLLTGTKTLTGRDMKAGEFTFVVTDKDGNEVVTGTQDGAKDGAPGLITFKEIEYDQTQVGEHEYTVTEKTDALPGGVSHTDPAQSFKVKVKVYIDDNGELQAVPVANETDDVAFTNVYTATGSTTLEITKALAAGDTWPAGESVTFTLASTDNGPMPEGNGNTVTLNSATNGTFGAIAWSNADRDKTYHYTITETAGFGDEWTISEPVQVTIKVTDDGVGHMNGAVTYDPADSTITNDHVRISTKVTKKEIAGGPELEGAHIQVIDSQGKVFAEWDSTTEPHTIEGLVIGEQYILRETVAPAGYTVTTDITFSVDEKGVVTTTGSKTQDEAGNDVILVEDEKTKVTVSKKEIANGPELPGAHIQILRKATAEEQADPNTEYEDEDNKLILVDDWTSGTEPYVIKGLKTGEVYTLRETVAPDGYTIAADTTFTIDEHGNVTAGETAVTDGHIVIEDAPTKVTVSKKGVTGSDELEGAEIQILRKATAEEQADPNTVYADTENKLIRVDGWTSGTEPHVIERLLVGVEYTLRETVAPDGYTIAADTKFTIDAHGNVTAGGTQVTGGRILINDALTKVRISKTDIANGDELEGATIQVINSQGTVVEAWVSGENGEKVHLIEGLKTGEEYTLRETVAPEGYTIATDITFTIDETGSVTTTGSTTTDADGNEVILVEDAKTVVRVSKTDIADGKELDGAKIQVIDSQGTVVEQWVSGENGEKVHLIEGLKTGEEYTLRETVAPEGYTIATDITFTIDETGSVTTTGSSTTDEAGNEVILVEDAKTVVRVSKTDIAGSAELAGATIQVIDKQGTVVEQWVSGENGEKVHLIEGLKTGEEYTLRETVAPEGYKVTTDITFKLDDKGEVKTLATTTQDEAGNDVILVEDAKTVVRVSKTDIADGKELPGATIQVIDSQGNVVEEWVSSTEENEKVHIIEGLKTGEEYTLRETVAPEGYTIATDITFTIDQAGNVTTTGTKTEDGIILVEDTKTKVTVSKQDIAKGKELPGAHIQIIDSSNQAVREWTSTTEAKEIEGLKTGEVYILRETVAPDGYTIAADTTFTIDQDGKVTSGGTTVTGGRLVINDELTKVTVSKKAIGGSDELEGAHLQVIDNAGQVVEEWDSTRTAHAIEGLKTGVVYTLRETVAPAGYTVTTDIPFTIDANGNVTARAATTTDAQGKPVILVEDALTRVHVSKTDIAGSAELDGAHIQVIDSRGNVVEDWVSSTEENEKVHLIEGLLVGEEYTLRETVAPDGYTAATDITFTIDKTGNVTTGGSTTTDSSGNTVILVKNALTKVTVSKKAVTGSEELPGADIKLIRKATAADGNGANYLDDTKEYVIVEQWTSGNTAHDIEARLERNTEYILRETVAPAGYTIAADTKFTIDGTGKVKSGETVVPDGYILIEDALTRITVTKKDIATGEELPGAKIQVIDSQNNVVEEWISSTEENEKAHAIEGLLVGEVYTLRETVAPTGYTVTADITFTLDKTGKVSVTGSRTADVYGNTEIMVRDAKTKITVSKKEIANGPELPGANIQIIDSTGTVVREWTSTDEAREIEGLKTGEEYTLRETVAPDGYTIAADTKFTIDETGKVTSGRTTVDGGYFLIEDAPTKLTVGKTIKSEAQADKDQVFRFTIVLDDDTISGPYGDVEFTAGKAEFGLKGGENAIILYLPAGTGYTVTEAPNDDFTVTKTGDTGTIGQTAGIAEFKNTRRTGDLVITNKVVSSDPADKTVDFEFTIELSDKTISGTHGDVTFEDGVAKITLKDGEKATVADLPTGIEYTVTQTDKDGFTTDKTGDTGTIDKDGSQADFTNTRKTGDLVITNTVISREDSDKDKEFTYTIELDDKTVNGTYGDVTFTNGTATITLKDGESATVEDLPTGIQYTVTQTDDDGFTVAKTGDTGTIDEDGCQADFINTRKTHDLVITNTVISDKDSDKDKEFTYTIELEDKTINGTYGDVTFKDGVATITLKDGESATVEDLPTGTRYTVTQMDEDGFTVTKTGDSGTIDDDGCQADFTNTRKTGDLVITNTVVSDRDSDKDKEFTYTIELDDKTINGTYGDVTFKDGVATITLKDGEKATVEDLPTDIKYTVTQTDDDGFTVTKTGDTGTIDEGGCQADFTNTRKTGDLVITNTVISDDDSDKDKEFKYTIELDDKTINGTYGDVTFKDGVAEITLKDGEKATVEDLPTDTKYTVTQSDDDGFTVEKTGDTGTIDEDGSQADFTNRIERTPRMTAAAVKKVWNDDNNRDGVRPLKVTVDLLANGTVIRTAELSQENHWMAVIRDLPETDTEGKEIAYTWKERDPGNGYRLTGNVKKGTLTILTNSRDPELTEIRFEQKWEDNDNATGTRPEQIRVQLYADGEACGEEVILTAKDGWKHTWTDLKKNSGGTETFYIVEVLDIPDVYRSEMSGDPPAGFVNTSAVDCGSLVIRKTFDIEIPEAEEEEKSELRDITVQKLWEDNDNADGNRPASVTVRLYAGGEEIRTAVLKEETGWKYTFTNLPKTVRGSRIAYSVTEDPVTDYTCQVNGFIIRNIYRPETTAVTVRKVWDDDNDSQGTRPAGILMRLSNGMVVTLNRENGWQATVTGLPKRLNGEEARYTWTEQNILGYQLQNVSINGNVTTFTNEVFRIPEIPEGMKPKDMPSGDWKVFNGYDIPLGVETIINHVGDCFD